MPPTPLETRRASSAVNYSTPESVPTRDTKTGYLGPTSYSAVYTENQGTLGIDDTDAGAEFSEATTLPPVTAEKIQEGAEVLALLKDMPVYELFTKRWFDICDGLVVIQPVLRIWIDGKT